MDPTIHDNPVAFIREHRAMYLPSEAQADQALARAIWHDAVLMRADEVMTIRQNEWWSISSNTNWLHHESIPLAELFHRMVRLPEGGPNAIRSEILLTAFCADVGAWTAMTYVPIRGASAPQTLLSRVRALNHDAAVFFRL